jgi:serine/threonine protein kinase
VGVLDSLKGLFSSKGKGGNIADVAKRFDLIGRTGQGSMSKVWRAYDRNLGRTVCLKLLDKEKTAKFEARFVGMKKPSEGEICELLRHKNIVQTFEHGVTREGEPYLVMELIEGVGMNFLVETRHQRLEGNRVNFLTQLADGIEFMHRQGFLHRDICPRNVMVNNDGVVKIIDLGLTIPYKPEFCRPGNRTGTTAYLAPELIKRQTTDHRVDMFALGVTAYELFTGALPWEKGTSEKVLRDMVNSPGKDPRDLVPDLPRPVVDFLRKAVERDPANRFQKPADFREALQALPGSW